MGNQLKKATVVTSVVAGALFATTVLGTTVAHADTTAPAQPTTEAQPATTSSAPSVEEAQAAVNSAQSNVDSANVSLVAATTLQMNADSNYASASAAAAQTSAENDKVEATVTSAQSAVSNAKANLNQAQIELNSASSALSDAITAVTNAENGQEVPAAVWKTGTTTTSLSQRFFATNAFVKLLTNGQVEITLHMTNGKQYVGSLSYKGTDLTASNANGDAVDWTFDAEPAKTYDLDMSINTPIGHMNQTATISVDGTIYDELLAKQKDAQSTFDLKQAKVNDLQTYVDRFTKELNTAFSDQMRTHGQNAMAQSNLEKATEVKTSADKKVADAQANLASAKAALTAAQTNLAVAKAAAEKPATTTEETKPASTATTTEETKPASSAATTTEETKPASSAATTTEETKPASSAATTTEETKPSTSAATTAEETKPTTKAGNNSTSSNKTDGEETTPADGETLPTDDELNDMINDLVDALLNSPETQAVEETTTKAATNATQKVAAVKKAVSSSPALPQTGNDATSLTLLGIALAMLGLVPLAKLRRY